MQDSSAASGRLEGLAKAIACKETGGIPPVETWNPPYCGDIGLAIAADGTWTYQGSVIQRPALVKLFSRILRRDADGKHYLVTPAEKVYVAVADAPFVAVDMQVESEISDCNFEKQLIFTTNVGDTVHCGPANPLRFAKELASGGLKPYVRVRGNLEALLTRAICYDLVALAETGDGEDGVFYVWSGGMRFALTVD